MTMFPNLRFIIKIPRALLAYLWLLNIRWMGSYITSEAPGPHFPWLHWVNNDIRTKLETSWEVIAPRWTQSQEEAARKSLWHFAHPSPSPYLAEYDTIERTLPIPGSSLRTERKKNVELVSDILASLRAA